MDWIGETLKYIDWRETRCADSTVIAALRNDGLSSFEATVLLERIENYGYVRYTEDGVLVVTGKGKKRIDEEPV